MRILIISGFLGAGKTTFIKAMTARTGRDFVVFENEYAQADVDKVILSQESNLDIWELTENCICCSGKQDFASSILTIANTFDPEYLLVEPTGAAKLSAIQQNIKGIEYERITLLKPVLIVDGMGMERQIKEYPDIYIDQLKTAEQIVLSKMEQADDTQWLYVKRLIETYNPRAEVLDVPYSEQPKAWWEGLLSMECDDSKVPLHTVEEEVDLESMTLKQVSLPSPTHLISLLEMVCFGVFGKIIRAKGYIACGREWLQFEVVDRTYSITGIERQMQAQTVFIGKELYRSGLREVLGPIYQERRNHPKIQARHVAKRNLAPIKMQ